MNDESMNTDPPDAARRASLPIQILQQWQVPSGYDRSFKISNRTVLANRYLRASMLIYEQLKFAQISMPASIDRAASF